MNEVMTATAEEKRAKDIRIFDNPEFGKIRTLTVDGEPWFVGKDVALALGYKEPTKAAREKVDGEDRGVSEMDTPSGKQNMIVINESGLYCLILSSKLPSAKKFKRWVTSEVLPSLRKVGYYKINGTPTRPITTDDYIDAARTVSKCAGCRLPIVLDLLEKAGLELMKIGEANRIDTNIEKQRVQEILQQYSVEEAAQRLALSSTTVSNYRYGRRIPSVERMELIIRVLG